MLSYKESDVRVRNILQSLTYNMAEKQLDRYDMNKLRHCHPMYTELHDNNSVVSNNHE